MVTITYTSKQIQFIMDTRVRGFTFGEVAEKFNDRFNDNKSARQLSDTFHRHKGQYELPEFEKHPDKIKREKMDDIINNFLEFVRTNNYVPTTNDMSNLGFNAVTIRNYFGNIEDLEEECRENYPVVFKRVIDEYSFTDEEFAILKEEVSKYKRFVITTAVTGCAVHRPALDSIKNYCKRNKAKLLVLPCSDPAKRNGKKNWQLDHRLDKKSVVFQDLQLNSKVFLSTIKLSAKHINPLTGLSRIGQRSGSFIYASPKQFLEYVAKSSARKIPRALMTTGAITKPQYNTEMYMSERTAYIADHDHIMGAIIVEITDDKIFFFRQIQMEPKTGAFIDIDTKYFADGRIKKSEADLVQLADLHIGETDPNAKKAGKEICAAVRPKYVTVEDTFNGQSINHHERQNPISRAMNISNGFNTLNDELKACAAELNDILSWKTFGQLIVKYGNHEDFLYRYLNSKDFVDDALNYKLSINISNAVLNEGWKNPFEYAMRILNNIKQKNIKFLENEDDSFVVNGIENGAHGHRGANGSRSPGMQGLEKCYGAANVAHSHSAGILRGIFRVGTSSYLKVSYNKGPSSWVNTHLIQHQNGSRQLINIINGEWRLED